MTMYEVLKLNRGLLEFMVEKGVQAQDVKHLAMYEEFLRMQKEGHKQMYIVAFLMDEYGVSEPTVYRMLRRFKRVVV